jgi:tellurite resistance protein
MNTMTATRPDSALSHLPVSLFGAVMSLCGLCMAWRIAGVAYDLPVLISETIGGAAVLTFLVLCAAYGMKLIRAPAAVKAEFMHPVAANFFGTFIISLLLLPAVLLPYARPLAEVLWALGALLMVLFAWWMVTRWMSVRQKFAQATPAWIVPVVGTLDIPIVGNLLGWPGLHEVALFSLAVGLFFTIPLFTLIFARLLFEEPMPGAQRPSLLILMAPFAVGFSAYVGTVRQIDLFASGLFYLALFMLAVLLPKLLDLPGTCPFRVSWWAAGFPMSAISIAALNYASYLGPGFVHILALMLLGFTTLLVLGLAWRTLRGIAQGELATITLA